MEITALWFEELRLEIGLFWEEGRVELSELSIEMCCFSTEIMLNFTEKSKTTSQFPHFALQLSLPASQLSLLPSFDIGLSSCHVKVLQSVLSTLNLASSFQFKKSQCYTFEMDQKCKPEAHQRLTFLWFFNTLPLKHSVKKIIFSHFSNCLPLIICRMFCTFPQHTD